MSDGPTAPRARTSGLVVKTLEQELLVYDLTRHQAHSLNPVALAVWRHLDGRTSVDEVARRLREELATPADAETVWLALRQLARAHLLETPLPRPAGSGLSRRQLLRRAGLAAGVSAVLVPVVTTVAVPHAYAQASVCAIPSCTPGSCAGGSGNCHCVLTIENDIVCVEPCCISGTNGCTSSANCGADQVCVAACCGTQLFCSPRCGQPSPPPGGACATIISG